MIFASVTQKGGNRIADVEFQRKKKFLNRYVKLKHHIDVLEEKLFELDKDDSGIHSPTFDSVGTSSNVREYSSHYDKVAELNDRINTMLGRARHCRKEIYSVIDLIENENEAQVLEMRFLDDLTFNQIAERTHYTLHYVEQLYAAGVKHIEVTT